MPPESMLAFMETGASSFMRTVRNGASAVPASASARSAARSRPSGSAFFTIASAAAAST
ncbi:MAG: hypothetical protein ACK5C3_05260 [bacterium]